MEIKFGTDGWRAVIGDGFTFENLRKVSRAVALTFQKHKGAKVFVGYDHRFIAERFAEESAKVLSSYGFRTILLPLPVTSPVLSFLTWKNRSPFGVMITASHNPPEYLGFKVKAHFGGSIGEETVRKIEKHLAESPSALRKRDAGSIPTEGSKEQFVSYCRYLKNHLEMTYFKKAHGRVFFDALYGPGAWFIKDFFGSFSSKIEVGILHSCRDPLFGGLQPEPIEENLSELKIAVKKKKALGGFALDGDGDRLGVVDEDGTYLTPQEVFALLLHYLAAEKKLFGKVVQTVSLGYLSQRIAQDFNLPHEEVPVGFKYVAEKIVKEEVLIGGEESGGYAFGKTSAHSSSPPYKGEEYRGGLLPERDGLFSALLFLEMLFYSKRSLSRRLEDLQKKYGKSCYLRQDLKLSRAILDKNGFVRRVQNIFPSRWLGLKIKEMRMQDGLKVILSDDSWLLLRPSGTEPLLRTYAEFPQENFTRKSIAKLSKLLYNVLKDKF